MIAGSLCVSLTRISHQFAYRHRIVVCCQYVMIICSLSQHNRLRLMHPRLSFCPQRARVHCAHPWAQPCGRLSPCKLSVLTICPSTIQICLEQIWTSAGCPQGVRHGGRTSTTAMLSVPVSSTGQAPAPAERHKSARSRFGHPKDARRVCAMEGAHQKSCAIIASTGEKYGSDGAIKQECGI